MPVGAIHRDPKAAAPMKDARRAPDGRLYVERVVQLPDGRRGRRKRYGAARPCDYCGQQYVSLSSHDLGCCSTRCAVAQRREAPSPKTLSPAGLRKRCDQLFEAQVRARGRCAGCGETDPAKLQCAHVVSRVYLSVRWDFDNAFCLCSGEHLWYSRGNRHIEWERFCIARMGHDAYEELKDRALKGRNPDYAAVLERLLASSTPASPAP